jgi:restriction endonuclease Mrr
MRIFVAHSYSDAPELAAELTRALTVAGHETCQPDTSLEPGDNLIASISTAIRRSDLMVALLTGRNLNVYYELGLATGAHVPTLVASRELENIGFDLASAPYVQLTGNVAIDVEAIVRRIADVAEVGSKVARGARQSAELTLAEAAADPSVLENVTPFEFERLVENLFEERGFQIYATPTTNREVDLIIGGDPPTIVEVKRYSRGRLVSVGAVRGLLGAMMATGAGRAILVSSSGFTSAARAAAAEWPVELMTLEDLLQLEGPTTPLPADPS